MAKVYGLIVNYAPVRETYSQVVISYSITPEFDGVHATWHEVYFNKKQVAKPTLEQIKDAIISDINSRVKEKIIGGFVWNDKPVWLSEENQMNFAQAVVPATFKIGEESDGTPIYQKFTNKTELKNFVEACVQWKQQCLVDGWTEKDSIDWSDYDDK